jgi:hypothetical protein
LEYHAVMTRWSAALWLLGFIVQLGFMTYEMVEHVLPAIIVDGSLAAWSYTTARTVSRRQT